MTVKSNLLIVGARECVVAKYPFKAFVYFLLLLFAGRTPAIAQETVRVSYSSVNPHALLVSLAEKRGLYKKYGLSPFVIYIPGGGPVMQALLAGDLDLAQLTGAPGVAANLRGADVVYIAMSDDRMGYQLVTRPELKKTADLKGRRFGISRFSSASEFGVRALLKKVGVDPKDVTILQIGNEAERLAALKSGSIDGSVFNAPFGAMAKKFEFNILADAVALGIPYFNTGIAGSGKLLQRNERVVLSFLRAYLEAIKIFKTESEYTIRALAQFTRVGDMELVKEAYEYNKTRIPDVPYPSAAAMQAVIDPLIEREPKLAKADAKSYITDRYLKKLEEEGFVQKLSGR